MKRIALLAVAALAVGAAQAQKPKISQAENMLLLQKYDDAKANIDEALAHEKSNTLPRTYIVASEVYATMDANGKLDGGIMKAKEYLQKAQELDQAGDAKGKGKGKNAKEISKTTEKFANNAINVGVNNFNNKNYVAAKEAFNNVIWAHKQVKGEAYQVVEDSVFYLNTALSAMQAEDYQMAVENFNICFEIDYDGPMSVLRANYCYQQMGDSTNMERTLKAGFEKYPEDKEVLANLIQYYLSSQQNDVALDYLNTAITKDPTNALFFYARGCLNEKINMENAIADYKKAIELKGDLFNALYNLAVVYYNKGIEIINVASGERDNKKYEALVADANEQFKSSAPYFEKAAECTDNKEHKSLVYEQLKSIYYRLGDYEKSTHFSNLMKETM